MPEDNKLIVPPFNKKDIRAIVQKDITDGEIVLPAVEAGTKLYEHNFNSSPNFGLIVITNSDTPITSDTLYGQLRLLINGVVLSQIVNITDAQMKVLLGAGKLNYYDLYNITFNDGTASKQTISETITDTVTEL